MAAIARVPEVRLVFARDLTREPFGRVLFGGHFVELGRAKPAVPLAIYLSQLALCADQSLAAPAIRCTGDATFGGRLYRAFSMNTWPRWASPFEALRVEEAWPPWRLDRGWLKPKVGGSVHVVGVCQTDDDWLGWRDDQSIEGDALWQVMCQLVDAAGWTREDLDPRLRAQYESCAGEAPARMDTRQENQAPVQQGSIARAGTAPVTGSLPSGAVPDGHYAGLLAAYSHRSEFSSAYSPVALFDNAKSIRIAGLSLNMLCQQYADHRLQHIVEQGATLLCLFLDPMGSAIIAREREEELTPGHLATLTTLNMDGLRRLRDRLGPPEAERIQLGVYDETIRFNLTFVDDQLAVVQPYLPGCRGIESPTFVAQRSERGGLYETFDRTFDWIRQRSTML